MPKMLANSITVDKIKLQKSRGGLLHKCYPRDVMCVSITRVGGELYSIDHDIVVEYHAESAMTDVPLLQHQFLHP